MKKKTALGLSILMSLSVLSACGQLKAEDKVATAGKEEIKASVASLYLRYQQAQVETYYGSMLGEALWDTKMTGEETYAETTKKTAIESLQEFYLLKAHAKDYKVKISKEEQESIDKTAKAYIEANDKKTLEYMMADESTVKELLELYTYQKHMEEALTKDVKTEVSDEEAAQTKITYVRFSTTASSQGDNGNKKLTEEEKAAIKEKAQKVYEKVAAVEDIAGADMDALAKEVDEKAYASSPSYGSDDKSLDEKVKEAVKGLEDGSLAPSLIEGKDAYYVVRLDKAFDEDATKNKKDSIVEERKQEAYKKQVDAWKKSDGTSVNKKNWKKIELSNAVSFKIKTDVPTEGGSGAVSTEDTAKTSE